MTRGRKPKPTAIRALEGDVSHRPARTAEPQPCGKATCPAGLPADARRIWKRYAPRFEAMGVLTDADEQAFALLCVAYAAWLKLVKLAEAEGPIVVVNGQRVPNPHLSRADREAEKVRKLLAEFGATPSARSRINVKHAGQPEADLDSFIGGAA
jgi:P27 family predicted phage terminase small subunit